MGELGAYKRELAALRRARMGAKYLEAAAAPS